MLILISTTVMTIIIIIIIIIITIKIVVDTNLSNSKHPTAWPRGKKDHGGE